MARPLVVLLLTLACSGLLSMAPAAAQEPAEPTPEQVKSLLHLLSDPAVKAWLERETEAAAPVSSTTSELAREEEAGMAAVAERQLRTVQEHLRQMRTALPGLRAEIGAAIGRLGDQGVGHGRIALLVASFFGLGLVLEWLFGRATQAIRHQHAVSMPSTAASRLRTLGERLLLGFGGLVAFAIGSVGAFLAFDWPPGIRRVVVGYLLSAFAAWAALTICRSLLAPAQPALRAVPMSDAAARFWTRWTTLFVAWLAIGTITLQELRSLGLSPVAAETLGHLLGIGLVLIALRIVWRPTAPGGPVRRLLMSALVVLVWALWVAGTEGMMSLVLVLALLPAAIRGVHVSVRHLFREEAAADAPAHGVLPTAAVILDRALCFVCYVVAVVVLVRGFGLDVNAMASEETRITRLAEGALHAVIVLLVADLLWTVVRTAIDRKLALAGPPGEHEEGNGEHVSPEESRRLSRMRTLLPILRIVAFAVLATMAVLMVLSALGVHIAPLIAGAGVVGVAIGFGSQTLVKDVISGVFYLLDDAFRVGEYVVSGDYRGTVEGFSLRSIKLRHHRGPLYTVPFGDLGAVQNLSRDWVIDKITVGVTYDTDLDLVKRAVKQVSREIMAEPELAKGIIEPLKSQGVFAMGDFAIKVRMKFKARPGQQFVVRRAVYTKIKKAFDANGIKFAFPTVTVAGGGQTEAAIAQQAMALTARPEAVG